ncbi:sensor histidine kinase, partial [Myxococcota bacterium]|nr:sensor histidine kinase [Myxococcota bacterium]
LLPVVENAVKHGIQGCAKGGELTVNIKLQAHALRVEVTNPVETRPRSLAGEGMGLRTLKRQLATLYGNSASLKAVSREGTFTVTIKIPAGEGNDDDKK